MSMGFRTSRKIRENLSASTSGLDLWNVFVVPFRCKDCFYRYGNSYCEGTIIMRQFYIHSYTIKSSSLFWNGPGFKRSSL